MIEKSTLALNNYDKLCFLDDESRVFLEKINVTNLLDRLTWTESEIAFTLIQETDYHGFEAKDLVKIYRNRG